MDDRDKYRDGVLSEKDANPDPFAQFKAWYRAALDAGVPKADAMTLATATAQGSPSARMVLLKEFDRRGFVFYTNYRSRKGEELEVNPKAALVFHWPELHRQVRITGTLSRVPHEDSERYFSSRPRGARLAAWASPQSEVVPSRRALEERFAELEQEYRDADIPLPPWWGGYRVVPVTFEFWEGREDRLHDRLRYSRRRDGWLVERLAP